MVSCLITRARKFIIQCTSSFITTCPYQPSQTAKFDARFANSEKISIETVDQRAVKDNFQTISYINKTCHFKSEDKWEDETELFLHACILYICIHGCIHLWREKAYTYMAQRFKLR